MQASIATFARAAAPFASSLAALAMVACGPTQQNCDSSAAASVNVSVVDQDGEPVAPSDLYYSVDGGQEYDVECMNADCSEGVAGWEETGEFEITAILDDALPSDPACWYDAEDSATVTVELGADGCHVSGEQVVLVLDTSILVCT